jgi:hypothetical protein
MRWLRQFTALLVVASLLLTTAAPLVLAQNNVCTAFIDRVNAQLATACANTEANTLCYGFEPGMVAFVEPVDEDFEFEEVGDKADLTDVLSITTMPYNNRAQEWGVMYLRGYANLSAALANEYPAVYFIVGDTLVFNEVAADEALLLPDEPLVVTTANAADLLGFPPGFGDRLSETVGRAAASQTLRADGVSEDGDYVRVSYVHTLNEFARRSTAWIALADLTASTDVSDLPVITIDSRTPMQEFSFIASNAAPGCSNLPMSQVLLHGPGNIETEFFVNELNIRLFSTVALQFPTGAGQRSNMRLIPLTGNVYLPDPDAKDTFNRGIRVPAGQYIDVPLVFDNEIGKYVIAASVYDNFGQFKRDWDRSFGRGQTRITPGMLFRLLAWEKLPGNLLNYILTIIKIILASGVGGVIPIFEGGQKPPLLFGN